MVILQSSAGTFPACLARWKRAPLRLFCVLLPIALCGGGPAAEPVVQPAVLDSYVARFNAADAELYPQAVPNARAAEFLRENVPWFECPDPEIERTYYFRWWTFRKHIQETPDGFVITEFLPPVGWASKHNTISCAAGHQLYEGRWLREGRILDDYTVFWLRKGTGLHRYSHWLADAIWARYCVNADAALPKDLLPDLVQNFRRWEGKDYNHSSYCDLIITGLVGLRPRADETVEVNPLASEDWPYFALDRIAYHGRTLTILWDRTGQRYGRGRGLRVLADGCEIAAADRLMRMEGKLP